MMKKRTAAFLLVLVLAVSCLTAGAEPALFADILCGIDYGDEVTYVIGHKSPDADTIGSAIAYAWLLQQLGINAKAAAAGKVNNETQYALDFFGMDQPEIISDAAGKQFILVDHSEYSQALDGMKDARVVGIVDHHGIGDVRNTERIAVVSLPAGATSSIIYKMYLDCGVDIPRDIARVMLMSILSDTKGMTSNVAQLDREACDSLQAVAEIGEIDTLYDGMKKAKTSFEGMTASEIFYSDYKEYLAGEITFGIGSIYTETEESLEELVKMIEAEFPSIYASGSPDMLFCLVSTDETTWMTWYGEDAEKAVQDSFPEYDGGGRMIFIPKASRKENIVPPLTAALENSTGESAASPPGTEQKTEEAISETNLQDTAEASEAGLFQYVHDPRENPGAMEDIIENPDAVYGFSPDPESDRLGAFADYDWTDPKFVAKAQEERRDYHEEMDSMTDILYRMREEGASIEEMARAVSEERNRLRIAAYENDPEGLEAMKKSNLKTYGHEEGPTPDQLYEKYGSWTLVMQKAFGSNMGMDACCGLYDEYYWLYIELGYVE